MDLDSIVINFNETGLLFMNITLAFIMFGIALDLTVDNFKIVLTSPKKVLTGMFSQLLLLPALTFGLITVMRPEPSLALGMILVASCPGGNISNFISALAKSNVELSIILTIISSTIAIFFTPINLAFYGNLYEPTQAILREVNLSWLEVMKTISLIIIIPILIGLFFKKKMPDLAFKLSKPMRILSMALFLVIVFGALLTNYNYFIEVIGSIFLLVLLHNLLALASGYFSGVAMGLPFADKKTLTIETGIQNSGLGLLLIFGFFDGLGGMAIITAWWGVWHILSGFTIAYFWSRKKK